MVCHPCDVSIFDNIQNRENISNKNYENKDMKLYQALSTGSALKYLAFSS
jgi:hypothetical protein